jgi:hypothetical protein
VLQPLRGSSLDLSPAGQALPGLLDSAGFREHLPYRQLVNSPSRDRILGRLTPGAGAFPPRPTKCPLAVRAAVRPFC